MKDQELYINDKLIDLSDDTLILFTYQKADYTNPTAVKNSYTKTVSIPGTPNNNQVFDSIFRLDRYQTSTIFNPSKRTPFSLFYNGNLVEKGYCKLTKINRANSYLSYEVTLYGGLGDFFYGLTYDDDGNKLNLADLKAFQGSTYNFIINVNTIYEAWYFLKIEGISKWNYINFAPCYNGLPDVDNFDADKVLVPHFFHNSGSKTTGDIGIKYEADDGSIKGSYYFPTSFTNGDDTFETVAVGNNGYEYGLITLPDECTEWEVGDLRSYMQRPVLKLTALFEAIQTQATILGYTLELDSDFFNPNNPYYSKAWITLPLLSELKEDIKSGDTISYKTLFSQTKTPFDYLVSYAKLFNLYFVYDHINSKISLLTRKNFYYSTVVDLEDKIDRSSVEVNPLNYDYKWLEFKYEDGDSETLDDYTDGYTDPYGCWKKGLDYDFTSDVKTQPDNIVFKNAADVLEKSGYFKQILTRRGSYSATDGIVNTTYELPVFLNQTGNTYSLFKRTKDETSDNFSYDEEERELERNMPVYQCDFCSVDSDSNLYCGGTNYDCCIKPQFHDDSNGGTDGADVLLFFNGFQETKYEGIFTGTSGKTHTKEGYVKYHITDDVDEMEKVVGSRCWIMPIEIISESRSSIYNLNGITVASLPRFNRSIIDYSTMTTEYSWDFDTPKAIYYPNITEPQSSTIHSQFGWSEYLGDLYNVNTREVTCKVKLPNIEDALRKFYYFDNSYWVITKISDYSYDEPLCKITFVKVNDISNYRS